MKDNIMTLKIAKQLMECVEQQAKNMGLHVVIAICNAHGNPIGVHVMDDALLVSYDVATKKAYTSVAVRTSTMELSKVAAPGGELYGLDKLDDGRIVIFGGGIPLVKEGVLVGGLGISGGTSLEDHTLAVFGEKIFQQIS